MKISSLFINLYAIIFSLLISIGFFGYGRDYYKAYIFGNIYGSIFDKVGYLLSILHYEKIWIGAFIASILQFIFYSRFLSERFKNSFPIYKILIIILLSFSWSHLLTSLNIVRQGIAVNIFLILTLFTNNKFINTIYIMIGLFLHKISPFLLFIKQLKELKILRNKIFKITLAFILFSSIVTYINITNNFSTTGNPGIDLKYIILFLLIIHSTLIYIKGKIIPDNIKLLSLFYPGLIIAFFMTNGAVYGERLFLNYLPFIFLSSLYIFKNNGFFRITYIVSLSSFVLISWTIGPLQKALY
tara:strand:+ start:217 stop:1116 length:900 start_codon:yes stop_codon:yes gene_type:complete